MLVTLLVSALAVPFADGNSAMLADADATFPTGPVIGSGPQRLEPGVIANKMQQILDRLETGGCTTTTLEYQAHVAGAYLGGGAVTGASDRHRTACLHLLRRHRGGGSGPIGL